MVKNGFVTLSVYKIPAFCHQPQYHTHAHHVQVRWVRSSANKHWSNVHLLLCNTCIWYIDRLCAFAYKYLHIHACYHMCLAHNSKMQSKTKQAETSVRNVLRLSTLVSLRISLSSSNYANCKIAIAVKKKQKEAQFMCCTIKRKFHGHKNFAAITHGKWLVRRYESI